MQGEKEKEMYSALRVKTAAALEKQVELLTKDGLSGWDYENARATLRTLCELFRVI